MLDAVRAEPGRTYSEAAFDVLDAFAADGTADAPFALPEFGDGAVFPGEMAMGFHFVDYAVHGWDVAASLGVPYELPADVVAAVLPLALFVPDGDFRTGDGAPFAPAVEPSGHRRFRPDTAPSRSQTGVGSATLLAQDLADVVTESAVHQLPGHPQHTADFAPREADGPGGPHRVRVPNAGTIEILVRCAEFTPARATTHLVVDRFEIVERQRFPLRGLEPPLHLLAGGDDRGVGGPPGLVGVLGRSTVLL